MRRRNLPDHDRAAAAGELTTVVVVGSASILRPSAFPQSTVWSYFGLGYGLLPLILPM